MYDASRAPPIDLKKICVTYIAIRHIVQKCCNCTQSTEVLQLLDVLEDIFLSRVSVHQELMGLKTSAAQKISTPQSQNTLTEMSFFLWKYGHHFEDLRGQK